MPMPVTVRAGGHRLVPLLVVPVVVAVRMLVLERSWVCA